MAASFSIEHVYAPQSASDTNVGSVKKSLTTIKISGDRKGQSAALLTLANAYLGVDNAQLAFEAARDSVPMMKEQGSREGEGIAKLLMVKARVAAERAGESFTYLKEAEALLDNAKGKAAVMLMDAIVKFGVLKYSEAEASAKEAISLFKSAQDKTGEAVSQLEMSKICLITGLTRNALREAEAAASAFASVKDTLGEASAKLYIAKVYAAKKNPKETLKYAGEVQKAAQDLKNGKLEVEALKAMADVQVMKKSPTLALQLLENGKVKFKSNGDKKSEAAVMMLMHRLYMEKEEDLDKALELCQDAVALYQQAASPTGEVEASGAAAECHFQMNELEDACNMAQQAMEVAREHGIMNAELKMITFLVDLYLKCDALEEARSLVDDAKSEYADSNEWKCEATIYIEDANVGSAEGMKMAMSFNMAEAMRLFQTSSDSFMRAREISMSHDDPATAAKAMQALSYMHLTTNRLEDSENAIDDAVDLCKRTADKEATAYALSQQCQVALTFLAVDPGETRRAKKALKAAKEACAIFNEIGLKDAEISALNSFANACLASGNPQGAWTAANEALLASPNKENTPARATSYLMLAGAHLGEGNYNDSRDAGRKAMDIFQGIYDDAGQQTAKDFVDNVDKYEKGAFNHYDFGGFNMSRSKPGPDRLPRRASAPKQDAEEATVQPEGSRRKKKDFDPMANNDIKLWKPNICEEHFFVEALETRKATGNVNKRKGEDKSDPFAFQRIVKRSESEQGRLKDLSGLFG